MGWWGYGIYDGDDTQTRQYDFLKWAKCSSAKEDEWNYSPIELCSNKNLLKKNIKLIYKKLPKSINHEDKALEWQMLLALFLNLKVKPPKTLLNKGVEGAKYLMGRDADLFDEPSKRKTVLRNFIKKAEKAYKKL